jgi:hypothetical protein
MFESRAVLVGLEDDPCITFLLQPHVLGSKPALPDQLPHSSPGIRTHAEDRRCSELGTSIRLGQLHDAIRATESVHDHLLVQTAQLDQRAPFSSDDEVGDHGDQEQYGDEA